MKTVACLLVAMATLFFQEFYSWESLAGTLKGRQPDATQDANAFHKDIGSDTTGKQRGEETMDIHLEAEQINEMKVRVGNRIFLESLRQSVVPPYLMIMPTYDLPDFIRFVELRPLNEDGVHGAILVLDVIATGQGPLTVGFKDIQTGKITHKKVLACIAEE